MSNQTKIKYPAAALSKAFSLTLCASAIAFSCSINAEESVDQRIKNLETQLKELKQETSAKKATEKKADDSSTKNTYSFGGFIKWTGSYSDYSDGEISAGSGLRDFYIPAAIPVGGANDSQSFDSQAKETRINFKSSHQLDNGETIKTFIEMDFLLPPGGNERISNSYNPRLRHAYFTYGKWLFGQTWSTFQDVGALPESADFLAASDGIVFDRQAMVRYTSGAWQFALENPETTVTPYTGGSRIVTDDNKTPDLVVRYNHKADWGHLSVAALIRKLAIDNGAVSDTESSTGISITGKFNIFEKDDIRFNFATGSGMGRYVGINTSNGAVLDANNQLNAIDSTLAAVAYRHHWNSQWRSNLIFSGMEIDNDTALTGTGVTESVNSYQLNLLYSPVPSMTFGVGLLEGTRTLESGLDGDMTRIIFTAKYGF